MSVYRLQLELHSALGTPLSADTVFGHVCWGMVYHYGTGTLTEFLEQMNGPEPPMVISDPMPADHWPMPVLPWPDHEAVEQLIAETQLNGPWAGCDRPEALDRLLALARCPWVPGEVFLPAIQNMSMQTILHELIRWEAPIGAGLVPGCVGHANPSRLTGNPIGQDGVHFDRMLYPHRPVAYDVYVASPWSAKRVKMMFQHGLEAGYGRDASIGKGDLRCGPINACELPAARAPNAVMGLGPFAPRGSDPTDGHWRLITRLGKLGGPWAKDRQVHKFPIILLAAGAVLRCSSVPPILGRMIGNVHPDRPEVQHYGLTPVLPIRLAR